jgi:hypothetical protein
MWTTFLCVCVLAAPQLQLQQPQQLNPRFLGHADHFGHSNPSRFTNSSATISSDNYAIVLNMSHALLTDFVAGSGYPQVWIRDSNTFLEVALDVVDPAYVCSVLLMFMDRQQLDGNIVDGIYVSDNSTFKNTVETDQETSFVQALKAYVDVTGNISVINQVVVGSVDGLVLTVRQRIERAFGYLWAHRYCSVSFTTNALTCIFFF